MKHKRQTLSKTDDEDSSKDGFKGDDDTQSCSKLIFILIFVTSGDPNQSFYYRLELKKIVSRLRATV